MKMQFFKFGFLILLATMIPAALALAPSARAAEKHPFGVDDWAALHSATAVAVAPDGDTILYRVDYGGMKGTENHQWRLIRSDGSHDRSLKLPERFDPFGFTADGTSLYGGFRSGDATQLAVVRLKGGRPRLLTHFPGGIKRAELSPDGARFAVLADPRTPDPLRKVRVVVTNPETSVYVIQANGRDGAWWCPLLKNVDGAAWSSDGDSLALESSTPKIGHHDIRSAIDVCTASGPHRVAEIPNAVSGIGWTAGNRDVVFLSTTTHVLTPDHVWTAPAAGGPAVDRTPLLDGSATNVTSDPRGNVWVQVERGVRREIDQLRNGALEPRYRWPNGVVESLPVFPEVASARDTLAFTVADPTDARNVAVVRGDNTLQRITKEGAKELRDVALGPVRVVHWTGPEKTPLEGIATFPAGYVAGRRYKFLVLPHGGPESNDRLHLDPFSRIIAGYGYVVLQPEYRGSTGYGSAFLNAIYQHFGDRAYEDVDSATDFAVAQGWADPHRLAIFGWSAGGFMTSWTVTQTQRYRAAVEGAGITDWLSFIPTSDIAQTDYDARWPERDPGPFLKFSAVQFADRVTTPLLIMDGTADVRVPTFQGREYFILLAERKKTVKMILYPGSPHFPQKWEQRRNVFHEIQEWLDRYNP
jgi:dipeptidyl aminopeptidase/acylaminoacyl peptidase